MFDPRCGQNFIFLWFFLRSARLLLCCLPPLLLLIVAAAAALLLSLPREIWQTPWSDLTDENQPWVQVKESASAAPARQPLELGTPYSSVANTVTVVGTQEAIPIGTACGMSLTTTPTKPLCSPLPQAASHASQATGPGRGQVVQGGARLTGQHPGPRGLCVYRRPQTKGQRGTQCVAVLESLTRSE